MDIMLKWIAYVILSAAETWIGYRLFNTYLTRNSVRQRYYWLGVIFYFTFQMFSYVNESPMFSTAAYYFFFATIIAVVFFSDSLQNKITIALLFVIMNYACKTAMTGIALAWGEQTLPRELINYRIVMDPWSQMMACILFVLSLWQQLIKLQVNWLVLHRLILTDICIVCLCAPDIRRKALLPSCFMPWRIG